MLLCFHMVFQTLTQTKNMIVFNAGRDSTEDRNWSCDLFVLQTFLAPMNQVFPAEDDVNKHVEDNCKKSLFWSILEREYLFTLWNKYFKYIIILQNKNNKKVLKSNENIESK